MEIRRRLAADAALSGSAPTQPGAERYRTDHGIGTGRHTRCERIAGQPVETYDDDWHGRDAQMATWTSPPLALPAEVTGHAVVELWLASETKDAAVILYLEDVAPDGTTRYMTEGMLRALYRSTAPAPWSLLTTMSSAGADPDRGRHPIASERADDAIPLRGRFDAQPSITRPMARSAGGR